MDPRALGSIGIGIAGNSGLGISRTLANFDFGISGTLGNSGLEISGTLNQ